LRKASWLVSAVVPSLLVPLPTVLPDVLDVLIA
jgi:hypothetical protein